MDLGQIFGGRKNVADVFTPRRSEVNQNMYIHRPELEKSLLRAVKGSQHVLLFGESGNGKSWLYKKILDGVIPLISANCANADRFGSLTAEIASAAFPSGHVRKIGYSEGKSAGVGAGFANGGISHDADYVISGKEVLLEAFEYISSKAHGNQSLIVLENLESIFKSQDRMDELANILLLLDDPRYAILNIKFLIVGTPSGVLDYFSKTRNLESVSNRLIEVEKVDGFDLSQVQELVRKGFVHELKINLVEAQVDSLAKHIFHVTMGVAQRIHEYCEQLAYAIEDSNWIYSNSAIGLAETNWLKTGLRQSYSVVECNLNSRDTAVARRNQVIYTIGKIKAHQFYTADIEQIIKREFPSTIPETNMGVGSILSELARGEESLLIKNTKTGQFRVKDPRYTMCIRVILYKDKTTEKVTKKNFKTD